MPTINGDSGNVRGAALRAFPFPLQIISLSLSFSPADCCLHAVGLVRRRIDEHLDAATPTTCIPLRRAWPPALSQRVQTGFAVAPEWPAAGRSRGGHGRPHGRAPRVASGAREVRSQAAAVVERECCFGEDDGAVGKAEVGPKQLSRCAGWAFAIIEGDVASPVGEWARQETRRSLDARATRLRGDVGYTRQIITASMLLQTEELAATTRVRILARRPRTGRVPRAQMPLP